MHSRPPLLSRVYSTFDDAAEVSPRVHSVDDAIETADARDSPKPVEESANVGEQSPPPRRRCLAANVHRLVTGGVWLYNSESTIRQGTRAGTDDKVLKVKVSTLRTGQSKILAVGQSDEKPVTVNCEQRN